MASNGLLRVAPIGSGTDTDRRRLSLRISLAAVVAVVALPTTPASIRSPDAEVGYRVAESLARSGSFAVPQDLEGWPGFGLPVGRDGRRYSVFGPLVPVMLAPAVAAAEAVIGPNAAERIDPRPSHYYRNGLRSALAGTPLPSEERRGHLVRSVVSLVEIVWFVTMALVAYELGVAISGNTFAAWLVGLMLPLGTFALSYVTCLFSEILGMALTMAGLLALVRNDPRFTPQTKPTGRRTGVAGLIFGCAALAHISALLALPFVAWYAAYPDSRPGRLGTLRLLAFAGGAAVPLAVLGSSNIAHFGNAFETGRSLQAGFGYGAFVPPWVGLYGLTVSFGKGLLWYSSLVVLTLLLVPRALKIHPTLTAMVVAAFALRLVFVASRSDWHGGFCLGPRYMLLGLPFAIIPAMVAASEGGVDALVATSRRRLALLGAVTALVAQQIYFASGEVFLFYHAMKSRLPKILSGDPNAHPYFTWELSPLASLLPGTSGPVLFSWMRVPSALGWVLLSAVITLIVAVLTLLAFQTGSTTRCVGATLPTVAVESDGDASHGMAA